MKIISSNKVVMLILFLFLLSSCINGGDDVEQFEGNKTYLVKRVVDGDTFILEDGTRVRFIGIDTPETKHPRKPVQPQYS